MTATKILTVLFAMALAAIAVPSAASAQQDSDKGSGSMMDHKSGGGQMGHGMMTHQGMMGGMRGKRGGFMCRKMTGHVEGRLAFLKTELKITSDQESLWNDYAAAVRDNAKTIGERCAGMMGASGDKAPSLPERLDAQEDFMTARLEGLRAVGKALKPLYAALSDEQKQLADQFIKSSTGMM